MISTSTEVNSRLNLYYHQLCNSPVFEIDMKNYETFSMVGQQTCTEINLYQ